MPGARGAEPVVARSDVVASPAPRPKSRTWIVKMEKEEKETASRRESEHAREGGKKRREESRTTAVKPPYERNSRQVRSVRRCDTGGRGLASEMEEEKKRESERKRKRAGGREGASKWIARGVFLIFHGDRRNRKSGSGYSGQLPRIQYRSRIRWRGNIDAFIFSPHPSSYRSSLSFRLHCFK